MRTIGSHKAHVEKGRKICTFLMIFKCVSSFNANAWSGQDTQHSRGENAKMLATFPTKNSATRDNSDNRDQN